MIYKMIPCFLSHNIRLTMISVNSRNVIQNILGVKWKERIIQRMVFIFLIRKKVIRGSTAEPAAYNPMGDTGVLVV